MKDCSELYAAGYVAPGRYIVDPTGQRDYRRAVHVDCEEGWTYILKRGESYKYEGDPVVITPIN